MCHPDKSTHCIYLCMEFMEHFIFIRNTIILSSFAFTKRTIIYEHKLIRKISIMISHEIMYFVFSTEVYRITHWNIIQITTTITQLGNKDINYILLSSNDLLNILRQIFIIIFPLNQQKQTLTKITLHWNLWFIINSDNYRNRVPMIRSTLIMLSVVFVCYNHFCVEYNWLDIS